MKFKILLNIRMPHMNDMQLIENDVCNVAETWCNVFSFSINVTNVR